MTKIFFIGDTHFGKSYPFRRIYELNISERNLDVIKNCEIIVKEAIKEKADFVIFLGDLYDRQNISPTIRRIVRERIFIPLNEHNIKTFIIGGNHDSIRNPKRGADIQELANFSNVEVFTELKSRIIEHNGGRIGLIFLPFIHFDVLVEFAKTKNIPVNVSEHNYIIAQHILEHFIKQTCENKLKECDKRILMGHYYLEGAKIREINNPSSIYGEFKFNRQMVQKDYFNLVIFGHLHLQQTMWNDNRIIIPGSIDQIDLGERNTEKYYSVYDIETDYLEFREIQCRNHLKAEIEIPDNVENLTEYILDNLPQKTDIENSICKIIIQHPKGKDVQIDKKKVDNYFQESFYTDLIYKERPEKKLEGLRDVNLDPKSLYRDFLSQKYSNNAYYEDLKTIGTELLEKEMSLVDLTAKGSLSIKSIDMQHFNKYGKGPNKITFNEDLYVIKGPTGAGKSSILDAITFALFKRNTRKDVGLNLDEILYQNGYVTLEMLIGDSTLTVKRSLKSPKLDIKLDNKPLFLGLRVPEKEKRLEGMIGYDYEGFISSFFIRQQELQIFSALTSSERHERLVKLFKLKIFHNIYKKLKSTLNDFQRDYDNLQGEIIGLGRRVEELPQKENDLKLKTEDLEKKNKGHDYLAKEVQDLRKQIESIQNEASQYANTQNQIEETKKEIETINSEIQSYKDQQTEYTKLREKLKELKGFKEEKAKLEKLKEEIEKHIHEKDLYEAEIKKYNSLMTQTEKQYIDQLKLIKNQINDKEDRLSQLDVDMTKEEAFSIIKNDGILTERLSRLESIEIPMAQEYNDSTRLNDFIPLVKKTQDELLKLQPKQERISKDIFIADELETDRNLLSEQMINTEQKKQDEFEKFNQEIKSLEKTAREKGLYEDFAKKLQLIKLGLEKVQEQEQEKELIEEQLNQKKDYSLLIEKLEKDLIKLNEELETLKKKLKRLETPYQIFLDLSEISGKKQQQFQELETIIKGLNVEIEYITKAINEIKKTEVEIKEIKKKLKKIKDNIEIYTLLREYIFHLNGIPKFAIEKILPAISIRASEILSDLTDGKFNQISFKPLAGTRVGFEIYVFDGEHDREASSYSGGEKTQINAAIRFAIMEKIAEIPDTTGAVFRKSNTILIDEGDLGTLDDETARQRFVDKIFEMKSLFKKIILITHLEDVAEQFPNRIVIGWDRLGNSKIF
jgi:exonuclease SbcC